MSQLFTSEMFSSLDSHRYGEVLTREQVKQRVKKTLISHTEILLGPEGHERIGVRFYSTNHLFGYPILPKNFVPCTSTIPYRVAPREGFEEGCLDTAADLLRFDDFCSPEQHVIESLDELVDYLNQYYRVQTER